MSSATGTVQDRGRSDFQAAILNLRREFDGHRRIDRTLSNPARSCKTSISALGNTSCASVPQSLAASWSISMKAAAGLPELSSRGSCFINGSITRIPSWPPSSANLGSHWLTSGSSSLSRRFVGMYGGLDTTMSKLPNDSATSRVASCWMKWTLLVTPCSDALRDATSSAVMEISQAVNFACGSSNARDMAIAPLPVPISPILGSSILCSRVNAIARSTSCSVSGLGISTSGVTRNVRPQKCACWTM